MSPEAAPRELLAISMRACRFRSEPRTRLSVSAYETERAADVLHQNLARVVATAPALLIEEAELDVTEEDWLRDAGQSLKAWARWRARGESEFSYLAPGYDAGRATADKMAIAARYLSLDGDYVEGWTIPASLKAELRQSLAVYESRRRSEGGGLYD